MIKNMNSKTYVIGVDLGGTFVRSAAITVTGEILSYSKSASGAQDGYDSVLARTKNAIDAAIATAGATPSAIGLAVPGAIDFKKGIVTKSPNFPDWKNAPFAKDMEKALNLPVVLDNDANLAGYGEGWIGAGKDFNDFSIFTLGTGVGGGIVLDKKIWRGATGMAAELGHIKVAPGGRRCGCGGFGCLEAYSSANAVAKIAQETGKDNAMIDAKKVAEKAEKGDKNYLAIIESAGTRLGQAMAELALSLDITKFVIAGGMSDAFHLLEASMRSSALENAYTLTDKKLVIVKTALGGNAGLIGAAKLAFEAV